MLRSLKTTLLATALLTLTPAPAQAVLNYNEGGPASKDPAATLAPDLRRYIDAKSGSDANDGKSQAKPWKTLARAATEKAAFKPGTHILLKRGQSFAGYLKLEGIHGAPGKRIVIGAYGELSLPRPAVGATVSVNQSSYVMVRELDCVKLDASSGAHQVVIYDNVVHGNPATNNYPSNGIRIFGKSHHISVVSNLVYDLKANDCIVVHPTGTGESAKDSHWIIDNVIIGNSGMEDGVDLAMSELDDGDPHVCQDIKVVGNRIQMKALAGLSTLTGRGSKCISAGHEGRYVWIVGNTMGGSQHIGVNLGADKQHVQVSGNVAFANANNNAKVSVELHPKDLHTEHNTFIHTMANRGVVKLGGTNHRFIHNLLLRVAAGNVVESSTAPPASTVAQMDFNHYGYAVDSKLANVSFTKWQQSSGLDKSSTTGPAPGVTAPKAGASADDPRTWKQPAFLAQFVPDSSFKACKGPQTPGAYDCAGKRLGLSIGPLAGLDNGGYGWAGPLLVQAKLKALGVNFGGASTGDGGVPVLDAGVGDAAGDDAGGSSDADASSDSNGAHSDAAASDGPYGGGRADDGCSCSVGAARGRSSSLLLLLALMLLVAAQRRAC